MQRVAASSAAAAGAPPPQVDWKLHLPNAALPMRANAVKREPELREACSDDLYASLQALPASSSTFVLHDGPPYANGPPHLGHALNKVLKDVVNRSEAALGKRVTYVPGWDCHGLPIELKAVQTFPPGTVLTPDVVTRVATETAQRELRVQMGEFRSWAVMGDWEGRYETMDPAYERAQLLGFRAMVAQGRVHQGVKPVWWSPATRTALAEAELEYHDDHVSQSAYVSFPFVSTQCDALKPLVGRVSAVAWTTTPWTLPANRALCVHEELPYVVLDGGAQGFLLVAEALAAPFSAAMGHPQALRVVARVTGAQLLGSHVKHPVHEADASVVLGANFVTTDTGTGVVHCAPGHGQDDYLACVEAGIAPFSPVDDAGNYDETVGVASLVGLPVLGAGGERVVQMLLASGRLLSVKPFTHKYPYDWRSKTPVLVRSTPQWFLDSRDLQAKALAAIEHVRFVPASGKSKFARTLSGRKEDWCISRQRFWGVPLPAFYHRDTRRALLSVDTVDAFLARMEATKSGVSVWWTSSVAELLPPAMRHQAEEWEKGSDTLDVWMDSGLSWSYLRERGLALPVDMVLEGTDQYRGWFQSSLLTWLAAGNSGAPWKSVVVHGFCLDSQGVKMSKAS